MSSDDLNNPPNLPVDGDEDSIKWWRQLTWEWLSYLTGWLRTCISEITVRLDALETPIDYFSIGGSSTSNLPLSVITPIVYTTLDTDSNVGSSISSSGVFTATSDQAGLWQFDAGVRVDGLTTSTPTMFSYIYLNGVASTAVKAKESSSTLLVSQITKTLVIEEGDVVDIRVWQNSNATADVFDSVVWNYFTGKRVGNI